MLWLLAAVGLYAGIIAAGYAATGNYAAYWLRLGVPGMQPIFGDLHVITAGWDCLRLGHDPLLSNPCDLWKRPMNYPRLWQAGAALGLTQTDTPWLGTLLTLLFMGVIFRLVYRHPAARWRWYWPLAVLSPHVMLAVERGNSDLLIFSLLAGAVWLVRRSAPWRLLGWAVFMLACVLKLYPIFAIGLAGQGRSRRKGLLALALLLVFGMYVLLTFNDLSLISAATPRENFDSFGLFVLPDALAEWFALPKAGLRAAAGVLAAAIALFVLLKNKNTLPLHAGREAEAFFVVGAGIYVGSFLLGNNFNYRFVFTLLTLPLLLAAPPRRRATLTLAVLLITLYSRFLNPPVGIFFQEAAAAEAAQALVRKLRLLLEEGLNWVLWGLLLWGLLQSRCYRLLTAVLQQRRLLLG